MEGQWQGEAAQDQGARPYQEDSWALRDLGGRGLLAVLADGMGGHAGGAVASRVAVETFVKTMEGGGTLADALDAANRAVGEAAEADPKLANMGATLVGVTVSGEEVRWVSVGDSPMYLLAGGKIERVNADHSMAPQIDALVARGLITAKEAAAHPGRHSLREAVMGHPLSLIDEGHKRLAAGSRLLICSDGVQSLPDQRIATIGTGPAKVLIEAVLAAHAPHQDNVTVIKLERKA